MCFLLFWDFTVLCNNLKLSQALTRLLCPLCSAMKCPTNSHYEVCAPPCPASCNSMEVPQECQAHCEEGCSCNEGYVLSGNVCTPSSECGCTYEDRYYRIGQVFYPNGQCQEQCTCTQDGEVINTEEGTIIHDWCLMFLL